MNALFHHIVDRLTGTYTPAQARELAFVVLEETTSLTRTQLLCDCKDTPNIPNLEIILQKILQYEPIEYIFGHTEWMGLHLRLSPATLIPRPETAELVTLVSHLIPKAQPIHCLDIGTGSGCIALALKQLCPSWTVEGIDISPQAVAIAQENAAANGLEVSFREADIMTEAIPMYDLIVSNPPYVRESEKVDMQPNVLNWEPAKALFVPDEDPLCFYRRIASLHAATYIAFEFNEALGEQMEALMNSLQYDDVLLHQDQFGKTRFVTAHLKPNTK